MRSKSKPAAASNEATADKINLRDTIGYIAQMSYVLGSMAAALGHEDLAEILHEAADEARTIVASIKLTDPS